MLLTDEQKSVYKYILNNVSTKSGKTFFLDPSGGNGKNVFGQINTLKVTERKQDGVRSCFIGDCGYIVT